MTTYAVPSSYATIALAYAATPGSTYTSTQQINISYQSGGYNESGGIVISGAPSTSSYPLVFNAVNPFNGTPGAQVYIYDSTNSGTFRLGTQSYVQFIGLEIRGGTYEALALNGSGSGLIISGCYISNTGGNPTMAIGSFSYSLCNSIIYCSSSGQRPYDSRNAVSATVDNCVIGSNGADLTVISSSESTITNTYAFGGTTGSFWHGGSPSGSYNASDDTSASTFFANSINSVSTASAITSVGSTWTQAAGSNPLKNAGTYLSAFNTDIFGNPRPGSSPWDIGPWQHTSAPVTVIGATLLMMGVG